MTRRWLLAATLLVTLARSSSAQTPEAPVEPSVAPPVQLGPVSLRPAVILREVGYDSNVLHESHEGEADFTATLGARLDVGLKARLVQATYTTLYEYVYFEKFEDERGSNRGAEGRVDFSFQRLRPYVIAGVSRSHERPSAEVDARVLRLVSNVGAGATLAAASRTSLHVGYRNIASDFADEETFRGIRLADELNGTSEAALVGADFVLSPLTTVSAHGEYTEDRFHSSPDRDANSYRYGVTAILHPLALISGRATLGVRGFRPLDARVRDFTGVTAAIAVSYAVQEETRVGLTVDRDLRYSFAELTPYYVSTGGRLTITHRLVGDFDGQVFGGFEQLAYEARLDTEAADAIDTVRLFGGGVGFRLGDGSRIGITADYATRTSPAPDREYSRARLYATLNYGF
jgi:hypothetical protein